jgi:hypothetical protein
MNVKEAVQACIDEHDVGHKDRKGTFFYCDNNYNMPLRYRGKDNLQKDAEFYHQDGYFIIKEELNFDKIKALDHSKEWQINTGTAKFNLTGFSFTGNLVGRRIGTNSLRYWSESQIKEFTVKEHEG